MAEPQTGMSKPDMKRLLALSKKEPVNAAIGLGDDAAFGLLMLDKRKQPRMVEKMLTEAVPAAKNTRWGTAVVDPDDDPKLVRLIINRPCSGMARKLAKTLKGTGFNKVLILLEDGTEVERHVEADDDGEGAHPSTAQPSSAQPSSAQPSSAQPFGEPVPVAPPAPPATPAPTHADLARRLAGLIRRIPQAAPAAQPGLAKLANAANAALKSEDLAAAATTLDQIEAQLGQPPTGPGSAPTDGAAVRVAKGLLVWNSTRSYVGQQVKTLQQAILDQSNGEPDFDEIRDNVGRIDELLELLDDRLSEKLDALRGATDPGEKSALTDQARQIVIEYQSLVAEDPLMADIDDNGFIPLDVKAKVTAALDAVLKTI